MTPVIQLFTGDKTVKHITTTSTARPLTCIQFKFKLLLWLLYFFLCVAYVQEHTTLNAVFYGVL